MEGLTFPSVSILESEDAQLRAYCIYGMIPGARRDQKVWAELFKD